jgi:cbb3-type cytochrome c oxidase subunit III
VPVRVALAAFACIAFLAAGCGTGGVAAKGNTQNGKTLFTANCASCHTLGAAGASGKVGPNLDEAFAAMRASGKGTGSTHFEESTIRQVVADQIKYPAQRDEGVNMPANLVKGSEVDDVAAYVASVAGTKSSLAAGTSSGTTSTNGETIFTSECASCHTLAAAGTHGTVGPNLDQLKPPFARVQRQVVNGGAIMPAFKGKLTDAQITAVAKYVAAHAGKK